MKVSDMDKDETAPNVAETPRAGAWLGAVGGAIAIVIACAVLTMWS